MISVDKEIFAGEKFSDKYRLAELLAKKYYHYQHQIPVINVIGTNGKGSVSTYLAQQLQENYNSIGLFTSPAFLYHNERIKVNGVNISDENLYRILSLIKNDIENYNLTFFEIWVLIALIFFAEQKVDYAVIEAGIGGRLDATRFFLNQKLVLLTSIGYDHMEILGNNLSEILWNKVKIAQEGTTVIISEQCQNFLNETKKILPSSKIIVAQRYLNAITKFQEYNIGVVIAAMSELQLKINFSFFNTIPILGRFTILQKKPLVILDGAHNEQGIELLISEAKKQNLTPYNTFVLYGASAGKNYYKTLALLENYFHQQIKLTTFDHPRSWNLDKEKFSYSVVKWEDWLLSFPFTKFNLIICGSLFFIPKVYLFWQNYWCKEE